MKVPSMLLMDTCALIWLVEDLNSLGSSAKSSIAGSPDSLHISAISALEISLLAAKKRIILPMEPFKWYSEAIKLHGITELPVTGEIAALSGKLPMIHKDPCDRIIIATAMLHKMKILTADDAFRKYEGVKVVW
ncbi:MAG TPA: PIN domain nuclease [Lentisphaeria bacterium]|nr:PIN domain nuclease [Lentisphaeria bacterium]